MGTAEVHMGLEMYTRDGRDTQGTAEVHMGLQRYTWEIHMGDTHGGGETHMVLKKDT